MLKLLWLEKVASFSGLGSDIMFRWEPLDIEMSMEIDGYLFIGWKKDMSRY